MSKVNTPKGTRDFLPEQVIKRNYIFDVLKKIFTKYGFAPIETPTMERLDTLTGKYGEEGDRLLFKVLSNGDFLAKVEETLLQNRDSQKITHSISSRGLRYDLTVPFARFVVQHQNDLAFPFKRYQIQPVWRADRPQRGRYQEFYQCDVDVIGSDSLLYEAELIMIYDEAFAQLNIPVTIKVNNRKILTGIAEVAGIENLFVEMCTAIDKLDKIGEEGVQKELLGRGISLEAVNQIFSILKKTKLEELYPIFASSEIGKKGLEELEDVHRFLGTYEATNTIQFDTKLARGLNYYTGCIFEVTANGVNMGSIGGGGRYADLTGVFGLKNMSGVGVSFGAERIYDIMEELQLFPEKNSDALKVLFVAFDSTTHLYAFECVKQLRKQGINADIYPTPSKMKKQMKYANARQVPYVAIVGSEEMQQGKIMLKNMQEGSQELLSVGELVTAVKF